MNNIQVSNSNSICLLEFTGWCTLVLFVCFMVMPTGFYQDQCPIVLGTVQTEYQMVLALKSLQSKKIRQTQNDLSSKVRIPGLIPPLGFSPPHLSIPREWVQTISLQSPSALNFLALYEPDCSGPAGLHVQLSLVFPPAAAKYHNWPLGPTLTPSKPV